MSSGTSRICVVSGNAKNRLAIEKSLGETGTYECLLVDSVAEFRKCQAKHNLLVCLVDRSVEPNQISDLLLQPGPNALATFGVIRSPSRELQALESAARYQLRHPAEKLDLERMIAYLETQASSDVRPQANRSNHLYRGLVGDSPAILELRDLIQKISASRSTVLIVGETGTGKEIVARNIHYYSNQSSGPFVPVNCSAIPPDLLESELFGHKKGAFTGALTDRIGRFEMAAGGTLFLDEIGDMTPGLQAKLLRVLEERVIQRVGCNKTIQMTARLVAATHRNLEDRIRDGDFREDLFYRLNVVPVDVPSLRERKEDIPNLSVELSRRLQREQGMTIELTPAAMHMLQSHDWPGNVRELANLIERLAVVCPSGMADVANLPDRYRQVASEDSTMTAATRQKTGPQIIDHNLTSQHWPEEGIDLKSYMRSTEATLIQTALDRSGGTMSQAAKLLHVGRTTLLDKVKRLGLNEPVDSIK